MAKNIIADLIYILEVANFLPYSFKELVEQMISKDSKSRLSAAEFMNKYRGKINNT